MTTGALGLAWLVIWAFIARPPFPPAYPSKPSKVTFPNLAERRVWALVFSYALPAISPGPVLTILSLYLTGRLGLNQAEVNGLAWIPPLTWGHWVLFLGMGCRHLRCEQCAASEIIPSPGRGLVDPRHGHLDHVRGCCDDTHLIFDFHRRRFSDGRAEGGILRVSA